MGLTKLMVIPWRIFITIGIWRSSDKYKGHKAFSILAKIMMVIWSVNYLAGLLI